MCTLCQRHPLPSLTQLGSPRGCQELIAEMKRWGSWERGSGFSHCPLMGLSTDPWLALHCAVQRARFPESHGGEGWATFSPSYCFCLLLPPPFSSLLSSLHFPFFSPLSPFPSYLCLTPQFPTHFPSIPIFLFSFLLFVTSLPSPLTDPPFPIVLPSVFFFFLPLFLLPWYCPF